MTAPFAKDRRLVWTIVDGPYRHHQGAAQVFAEDDGTRFVWTADLLAADDVAAQTDAAMAAGIATVMKTLEGAD